MVKPKQYIPDCGDIVWLMFNPQPGREQSGRRPALVISPAVYNGKTNLAIFYPVTSRVKGYPFEVKLPGDIEISGVILSDQTKNLDWKTGEAEYTQAKLVLVFCFFRTHLNPPRLPKSRTAGRS
ncbi:MAG: type II toxin-antitoxin system PemK/MazF family toxin [Ignavibacteria bacterium]|jgi:mRNA interferase MazF